MPRPFSVKICSLTLALFFMSLIGAAFHTHEHSSEPRSQTECSSCSLIHAGKQIALTPVISIQQPAFTVVGKLHTVATAVIVRYKEIYSSRAPPSI